MARKNIANQVVPLNYELRVWSLKKSSLARATRYGVASVRASRAMDAVPLPKDIIYVEEQYIAAS